MRPASVISQHELRLRRGRLVPCPFSVLRQQELGLEERREALALFHEDAEPGARAA
jgi:hypothetical protein